MKINRLLLLSFAIMPSALCGMESTEATSPMPTAISPTTLRQMLLKKQARAALQKAIKNGDKDEAEKDAIKAAERAAEILAARAERDGFVSLGSAFKVVPQTAKPDKYAGIIAARRRRSSSGSSPSPLSPGHRAATPMAAPSEKDLKNAQEAAKAEYLAKLAEEKPRKENAKGTSAKGAMTPPPPVTTKQTKK